MAAKKSLSIGKKIALKESARTSNGNKSKKAMLQEESMEASKPKQQPQSKFPTQKLLEMPKSKGHSKTMRAKQHAKAIKKSPKSL